MMQDCVEVTNDVIDSLNVLTDCEQVCHVIHILDRIQLCSGNLI